jgi:hypothetical protein
MGFTLDQRAGDAAVSFFLATEARMAQLRRDGSPHQSGVGAYVTPILMILGLLACYALLADWRQLPSMVTAALSFGG